MLERRPSCENCDKDLPVNSTEAMICAFECTFCSNCVDDILENVCPNCGGDFVPRPIMPKKYVEKYPPSTKRIFKPINQVVFQELKAKNKHIQPEKR